MRKRKVFGQIKQSNIKTLTLIALLLSMGVLSAAQDLKTITIKVTDSLTGNPVQSASLLLTQSKKGSITDQSGTASISFLTAKGLQEFKISATGYHEKTIMLDSESPIIEVKLAQTVGNPHEIVVSGTRKSEKLISSPITIEKYGSRAIRETSGLDFLTA